MNSKTTKRPIVIVDGFNNFLRHYLVNGAINSKSEPIGGVVGFIKFIDYISRSMFPSKIFVVWESGGGSARRRSIFKEYKKNRSKTNEFKKLKAGTASMRDQLASDEQCKIQQLTTLYKLLKTTPVCQVYVGGTECDDIVAYLASQYFNDKEIEKIIVSGDKDFYQLLEDESITIYDPSRKEFINNDWVYDKFKIPANNFCLAKAFSGDKSDNLEGVPGVGMKTLTKRFPEISNKEKDLTIKDVVKICEEQVEKKAKQKVFKEIIQAESIVKRNWKLMYLTSSMLSAKEIAKINYTVENHEPKMDKISLIKEIVSHGISIAFDFDSFSTQMRIMAAN